MKRGKRYVALREKMSPEKIYTIDEALSLIKEGVAIKFDESVEVHAHLSVNAKKGDEQVRGTVVLPHGSGKKIRIGVVTEQQAKEAKNAGADVIGGEELASEIASGKVPDIDVLLATPEMMPKLAKAAKVLGPRGLMPNPKTETVTQDIAKSIDLLKKGKIHFKVDNTGNIHQVIGKRSFDAEKLKENYSAILAALQKARPNTQKGPFIKSLSLCATMGPSVRVQIS